MSIHYVVRAKKNPRDPEAPVMYYPVSKSLKPIDREFLINDMVQNTSLNFQEAATGIDYLFETLPKYLSLGFTVKLGKMGYFRIVFRTDGSLTPEEVTTDKITRRKLVFVCGHEIRKAINAFHVEKFPESDPNKGKDKGTEEETNEGQE